MMLTEDQLKIAVQDGVKSAERCTRFCTYGGTVVDGRYEVFHNSIGPSSTDSQVIHHNAVLSRSKDQLAERIKAWVAGLHTGVRVDLNVLGLATGGWAQGMTLIGDEGPEVMSQHRPVYVTPFTAEEALRDMQDMVAAGVDLNAAFEREVNTRGPALAGWPWAGGTLRERDQVRLHTGDHFAHVEDGA